jgi:hypothetical protein
MVTVSRTSNPFPAVPVAQELCTLKVVAFAVELLVMLYRVLPLHEASVQVEDASERSVLPVSK